MLHAQLHRLPPIFPLLELTPAQLRILHISQLLGLLIAQYVVLGPLLLPATLLRFRLQQQYRRRYPDEFLNKSNNTRGEGDYQIEYTPAPRITEADKINDKKSLNNALDRRLCLLLYGNAYGVPSDRPVWHFSEKVYNSEEMLRKCGVSPFCSTLVASALQSVLGDLSNTYFAGNVPMGHMTVEKREDVPDSPSFK